MRARSTIHTRLFADTTRSSATPTWLLFDVKIKRFYFFCVSFAVADDMDQDECDETIGSDIDDRASETDSKKGGSRGTSRGSSNEGKSQGNSSKPRRYV